MPALTRFTYGALTPLTVADYTLAEISVYVRALDQYQTALEAQQPMTFDRG